MGIAIKPTNAVMKSLDSEKVAASAIASPMALADVDAFLTKGVAEKTLVMTGEHLNDAAGSEDALANVMSTEDLVAAAVEDYAHAFASPAADEAVLLAQSGRSTDAGGGLVQQEEEDDSGGGAGWLAGLGLLALAGAAAGGGGGGTSTDFVDVYYPSGSTPGYLVKFNGGFTTSGTVFVVSTIGGQDASGYGIKSIAANSTGGVSLSLPNWTLDLDSSLNVEIDGTADIGCYQILRGELLAGAFTTGDGNDLLVIWDSDRWGNKDYGIVIENVADAGIFQIVASNGTGGTTTITYTISYDGSAVTSLNADASNKDITFA